MKLRLTRTVTDEECPWLTTDHFKDETVYRYDGYTYGCMTPYGVACCEAENTTPFFELPEDAVEEVVE